MKKNIIGVLFLLFAAVMLAAGIKQGGNATLGGILVAALLAFLGLRRFGILKSKKKQQQPDLAQGAASQPDAPQKASPQVARPQPQAPRYRFVNFKVAGTSFKNEDGTERQAILRHIKFQDAPYVTDADSVTVHIQPYEYEGSPAYKCLVNGYTIGNVPKDKISEVAEAMRHDDATVTGFEITGGGSVRGEKLNYGCNISIRYAASLQE